MTRILALCAACALLSGCFGGTGGALQVRVPVPIPCRETLPTRPAMPTEGLVPGGPLFNSTTAMQAEIEIRESYEGQLRQRLGACIAPIKAIPS